MGYIEMGSLPILTMNVNIPINKREDSCGGKAKERTLRSSAQEIGISSGPLSIDQLAFACDAYGERGTFPVYSPE